MNRALLAAAPIAVLLAAAPAATAVMSNGSANVATPPSSVATSGNATIGVDAPAITPPDTTPVRTAVTKIEGRAAGAVAKAKDAAASDVQTATTPPPASQDATAPGASVSVAVGVTLP